MVQALADGQSSFLGVRCEDGEITVAVITTEDADDKLEMLNLGKPSLLLSIDGGEKQSYEATLSANQNGKIFARISDDKVDLWQVATNIAQAKKRVDFAVELLGKAYYASKTSASGSKKHVGRVLEACPHEKP